MNTDDRQQQREQAPADAGAERSRHIDTLARLFWTPVQTDVGPRSMYFDEQAEALFTSTDPAVHDALTAALIAHADRGRVLAALADAGWLGVWTCGHCRRSAPAHAGGMPSQDCIYEPVWEPTS